MSAPSISSRRLLAPLALAQFICSFAGSNMNVMINDISHDLDTTVKGVQTTITLFLLIMAVLMIPCSKLTDRFGRKRCFVWGLVLYGIGALLSAAAPGLGVLILGNSIFEGVGTALLIPPVYILATLAFSDLTSRARAFGVISGMAGIGAAAGPLIGGVITSAISWRAAFVFQALIIAVIIVLSRRVRDPLPPDPSQHFDGVGAVLSAVGMFFVVFGILQAQTDLVLMAVFVALGLALLLGFFVYIRAREREGKEAAALDRPVPGPHVQPRPRDPEHPVAPAHGHVLRRGRVPADGPALQRDQDRGHLHRGDRRRPRLVARRRAAGQAPRAAHAHPHRLRRHHRRHRAAHRVRRRVEERVRVRARACWSSGSGSG